MNAVRGGLIVLLFLFVAAPARAATPSLGISAGVGYDGMPVLFGYGHGDSATDGVLRWSRCAAGGGQCDPIPEAEHLRACIYAVPGQCTPEMGSGHVVLADMPAPGTVFEAVYASSSGTLSARTSPWTGPLTAATAPTLTGEATVGGTVTPLGASWSGGWGLDDRPSYWRADSSSLALIACRQPDGGECWRLPDGPLDARWAGWYLLAEDQRAIGSRAPEITVAMTTTLAPPYRLTWPLPADARRALSAPVGPIRAVAAPPLPPVAAPSTTTGAPKAAIRSRLLRSRAGLQVASVTCPARCGVVLTVSDGRRTVRKTFRVIGTKALRIARNTRLRRGSWTVRVTVDGKVLAEGRTR